MTLPSRGSRFAAVSLVVLAAACADDRTSTVRSRATALTEAEIALTPLPYPTRPASRIKAIQPDFWPMDVIAGNNAGAVAMNFVWSSWETNPKGAPCDPNTEAEYDGRCFVIDRAVDDAVAAWTARGVVVTAIVYGVPAWARTTRPCSPVAAGFEIFCAPDNAADYARFAGMLARRYDGQHGRGRVADFVIHNEVNSNDWYDVGCGQGVPCDPATWIDLYARDYAAAYDRIVAEQATAKVLVSLEHHFLGGDAPNAKHPLLSGATLLSQLAPRVAPRAWRVAYHPYPPDLARPEFSVDDSPKVTYGNIGTLAGWLRRTFPDVPSSWDIQLTESGVSSTPPSSETAQAMGVCDSFRNVLGTPGITSYVYHRMLDHPEEWGLGLGLVARDGRYKPAWTTWALADRADLGMASCGFEDLPYTRLTRSSAPGRGHWASSRIAPPGFTTEAAWHLLREEAEGTRMLYECRVGGHNLLSVDVGCEGLEPLGPVGYAFVSPAPGRVPIHRCSIGGGGDHFISPDPGCEGQTLEGLMGHALP